MFREIKLCTPPEEGGGGDERICGGRPQNAASLIRQISVDEGNSSNFAGLAISVCPVMKGKYEGSTQMVYFNDGNGMVQKGKIVRLMVPAPVLSTKWARIPTSGYIHL